MSVPGFFIAGTDTGVGKTHAAVALIHALVARGLRVAAMKPVAAGAQRTNQGLRNDDALALQAASNLRCTYDEVNPCCYEPPIAPHLAAREAGCAVDFGVLDHAFERLALRANLVIVEGAGGWLVPLDAELSMADLPARWALPVILVVGLRLGCLNHALLSAESIEQHGARMAGWIGNSLQTDFAREKDNIASLVERLRAPLLGVLAHRPGPADPKVLDLAPLGL